MYATYEFYCEEYHGVAVEEAAWERLAAEADAAIDRLTFGRLRGQEKVPQRARLAAAAAAEVLQRYDAAEAARPLGVMSATTDGYSESYTKTADFGTERRAAAEAAVEIYLPRADPLRYCGFYGEGGQRPCWDVPSA